MPEREALALVAAVMPLADLRLQANAIVADVIQRKADHPPPIPADHVDYRRGHAVDMAGVAVWIGQRLGLTVPDLRRIARGCLLHDIGMVFLDDDSDAGGLDGPVRRRSGVDPDRTRLHPTLGYDLLQVALPFDVLVNHIVWQHHERQDGTGYPRGLRGTNRARRPRPGSPDQIHIYADIAAIADVYTALVVERPYRPALSPHSAVANLRQLAGVQLNREVVEIVTSTVQSARVGALVTVTSGPLRGACGIVVSPNADDPERPVIQLLRNRQGQPVPRIRIDLTQDIEARIAPMKH